MLLQYKYLGLPFCMPHTKTTTFTEIIEWVEHKLVGWKSKVLSYVGMSTLIKAVIQILSSYSMQTYSILVGIYKITSRIFCEALIVMATCILPKILAIYVCSKVSRRTWF